VQTSIETASFEQVMACFLRSYPILSDNLHLLWAAESACFFLFEQLYLQNPPAQNYPWNLAQKNRTVQSPAGKLSLQEAHVGMHQNFMKSDNFFWLILITSAVSLSGSEPICHLRTTSTEGPALDLPDLKPSKATVETSTNDL